RGTYRARISPAISSVSDAKSFGVSTLRWTRRTRGGRAARRPTSRRRDRECGRRSLAPRRPAVARSATSAPAAPRRVGNSHARALTATTTLGGKAGRPPAPRQLLEAWQSMPPEAFSPLADDLA